MTAARRLAAILAADVVGSHSVEAAGFRLVSETPHHRSPLHCFEIGPH